MIGYAQREVFAASEQRLLVQAIEIISCIRDEEPELRCHELARGVGALLDLQVCDGYYGMVSHSWLWTGHFEEFSSLPNILDVYCPGRLPQVQLVHTSSTLPFEYRRHTPRTDIRQAIVDKITERFGDSFFQKGHPWTPTLT